MRRTAMTTKRFNGFNRYGTGTSYIKGLDYLYTPGSKPLLNKYICHSCNGSYRAVSDVKKNWPSYMCHSCIYKDIKEL